MLAVAVQAEVALKLTGEAHVTPPPATGLDTPVTVYALSENAPVTVQFAVTALVTNGLVDDAAPQPLVVNPVNA